jgi:hypothetical protein
MFQLIRVYEERPRLSSVLPDEKHLRESLTCSQRGWSVFEFLSKAVQAYFDEQPSPSLLGSN